MAILKYDSELIGYMNYFQRVTKLHPKDCFIVGESIIFIAPEGKAGLAIGKNGQNITILREKLKKQVRIVEFADDAQRLVANYVFPLKPSAITISEKDGRRVVEIKFKYPRERRSLLSNTQNRLKQLKKIVHRYHPEIQDLRVLQ